MFQHYLHDSTFLLIFLFRVLSRVCVADVFFVLHSVDNRSFDWSGRSRQVRLLLQATFAEQEWRFSVAEDRRKSGTDVSRPRHNLRLHARGVWLRLFYSRILNTQGINYLHVMNTRYFNITTKLMHDDIFILTLYI